MEKKTYVLWVNKRSELSFQSEYAHITARIMCREGDSIVNPRHSFGDKDTARYESLQFEGQLDAKSELIYGFRGLEYSDIHTVSLTEAVQMVKTLTRINRALDKIDDQYGHSESFQDKIVRLASVLKVDIAFTEHNEGAARYSDMGYHFTADRNYTKGRIGDLIASTIENLKQAAA